MRPWAAEDLVDEALAVSRLPNVAFVDRYRTAGLGDLLLELLGRATVVMVPGGHVRAGGGKGLGDGPAYPARAPRDHGHSLIEYLRRHSGIFSSLGRLFAQLCHPGTSAIS